MVDLNRVQGPSGSPEPTKKEKASTDPDKFKEMMKVEKVREVDPEEQKKRKRPEEAEEEKKEEAEPIEGAPAPTPTEQKVFFSGDKQKVSSVSSSKTGFLPPSEQGPAAAAPPQAAPPSPPEQGTQATPSSEQMQNRNAPTEKQPAAQPGQKQPARTLPSHTHEPGQRTAPPRPLPQKEKPLKEPGAAPQRPLRGESLAELHKKRGESPPKAPEKAEEEAAAEVQPPPLSPPPSAPEPIDQAKKREEKQAISSVSTEMGAPQPGIPMAAETPPAAPPPPYTYLHPQVLDLFERMAGVITVMTSSGITETTIQLTAPQFASSIFFGAQIIIQEFSTAPRAFNIQLVGTPQAVSLFQSNADDLMAAFQNGNYNFKVNRLDTRIASEERPLFKRKEAASGDNKDQGQQR